MSTETQPFDPALPQRLLMACTPYAPTPLIDGRVAGRSLLLKDETRRMGGRAFKALGGIYAVARMIEAQLGCRLDAETMADPALRARAAGLTFVCASAGNHGMAVATGAQMFGARARIHLSDAVSDAFVRALTAKGAEIRRSGATYEQSLDAAQQDAITTGALLLSDCSTADHTEPPRLVMEGYTVMAAELRDQLARHGCWPDRVYLQAGVGGIAAAVAWFIRRHWPHQPQITVVEPDAAPCLQASVRAGRAVTVAGPVSTMGRLDCKTPSLLALDILSRTADRFVTVADDQAAEAVRHAAEVGLCTTPSGAAGLAAALAEAADPHARPLVLITEGDLADDRV